MLIEPGASFGPTSLFHEGIFTRRFPMTASAFIRAAHPKKGIRPDPEAIRRVLEAGWAGQLKIHGHRCQLHVPSDPNQKIMAYNRQGRTHRKAVTPAMEREIRRLFTPERGWNVLDAEWLKPEDKLFVFDFLRREGKLLSGLPFPERWALLPRAYLSPHVSTLPVIRTVKGCLEALASPAPHVEGLIFRSLTTRGFGDTSIIRCRKTPSS